MNLGPLGWEAEILPLRHPPLWLILTLTSESLLRDGRGQNTDPQSMDCLNGLPKWTTPESHLKGEKQLFEGLGLGLGLWSETNGSHVGNVSKANG